MSQEVIHHHLDVASGWATNLQEHEQENNNKQTMNQNSDWTDMGF